ncbi:MAG: hypothetical protein J7M11_01140 [Elusimicrobia bacterium]|nr:hypothetical protein [Elusimicrobiota bacterium]
MSSIKILADAEKLGEVVQNNPRVIVYYHNSENKHFKKWEEVYSNLANSDNLSELIYIQLSNPEEKEPNFQLYLNGEAYFKVHGKKEKILKKAIENLKNIDIQVKIGIKAFTQGFADYLVFEIYNLTGQSISDVKIAAKFSIGGKEINCSCSGQSPEIECGDNIPLKISIKEPLDSPGPRDCVISVYYTIGRQTKYYCSQGAGFFVYPRENLKSKIRQIEKGSFSPVDMYDQFIQERILKLPSTESRLSHIYREVFWSNLYLELQKSETTPVSSPETKAILRVFNSSNSEIKKYTLNAGNGKPLKIKFGRCDHQEENSWENCPTRKTCMASNKEDCRNHIILLDSANRENSMVISRRSADILIYPEKARMVNLRNVKLNSEAIPLKKEITLDDEGELSFGGQSTFKFKIKRTSAGAVESVLLKHSNGIAGRVNGKDNAGKEYVVKTGEE